MRFLYTILIILLISMNVHASHIPGGNITYTCLGNDQYLLTLTLFEDCGTAFETPGNKQINILNDCGISGLTQVDLQNTIYAQEVSQLCAAQLPFSECSGGAMPGIYMHQWQGIVTLPGDCDSWHFGYELCCRNASTNIVNANGASFYIETTLNNADAACNNSATVTTQMIPYICVNQPITYNLGIYEPDGNTLSYSLINAQNGAAGGSLNYVVPNTGSTPIPGITINSTTGDLSFTPTMVGNFVVVVLVEELDGNGNVVGSLTQDFQFEVINCPANTNPVEPTGITNYTGGGTQISNHQIEVCPGDQFCFELVFTDLNAGDSIYISSNLGVALPGATFNQLSYQSPAVAEVCWTATSTVPSNTSVVFSARDNACPMFGITFFPVKIFINPGTYAGPDVVLCAGDTTHLMATGGSVFEWSSISGGDTIVVGNNFECSSCASTYALPSLTTEYIVTSDLTGLCNNTDTVKVEVVADFAYTLTQSSNTTCVGSEVSLEIITNPLGNYNIQWSPSNGLDDPQSSTPILTTNTPGIQEYAVSIESPLGCVRYDTIAVNVSNAVLPNYEVITSNTNVDCGDTVFFDVNILNGPPAFCGISATNACFGSQNNYQLGSNTGQNTNTTYPAPFGNWYKNAKHQFLFTASELYAMGFFGGKITEISWEVLQIIGTPNYYDYTINMGCTSSSNLTNNWEIGLVNVFTPQNINIVQGMNTLTLSSAYEWDGLSNLVVEICYNNLNLNFTNNSVTPNTNTGTNSTLYYFSDTQDACSFAGPGTLTGIRPVTYFNTCGADPDPNNFTYSWQSSPDPVDNVNSDSTFAIVTDNGQFEVFVTNLIGGCIDSTTIDVTANCCGIQEIIIQDVTCAEGSDGGLTILPFSNNPTLYNVVITEMVSGTEVYNQTSIVDTAFVNGLSSGNYQVEILTAEGCFSDSLVFIAQPLPFQVSIGGDSVICSGESLQLSATLGTNYSWTSAVSFVNSSLDTVEFNSMTSQMIYVEVENSAGCFGVDSLYITVDPLPAIFMSNDTTICFQDTISLSASGGDNYNWFPNYNISTLTGSSVNVSPEITTIYKVVVTTSAGCLDSTEVEITVQSLPNIDAGVDLNLCLGDSIQLNGSGSIINTWIFGDSILDVNDISSLVWPTVTNDYVLLSVDVVGCSATDTMTVTVNVLPQVDAGSDKWVCPGSTVVLVGSSDGANFTWSPASDLSDPGILTPDASPSDTIVYLLTVQSVFGCESVDSMIVYAGGPVPTDAGFGDTICEGEFATIGGMPTAVLGTSFSWAPASSIIDPTLGNPTVLPTIDTWYYVTTTNDTCSGLDSVFVKVNPYPVANAGADLQICFGDTTQLNASGGIEYIWNTSDNLSDSTVSNPSVYPVLSTELIVSVTDNLGCTQTDSILITVNSLPNANAGLNDTICYGQSTQLFASGGLNYSWSPADSLSDPSIEDPLANPSITTEYVVQVIDVNSCINFDTVRIVVNSLPQIDAGPDLEKCIYDTIQLSVSGAIDYIWSPDSTLSQFDVIDPLSFALDSEIYVVQGTDQNGCVNWDTIVLTVHELPVVIASPDVVICFGDTTVISATGANTYNWSPITNLADPNNSSTNVSPVVTSYYHVEGTDIHGCQNMDSVLITVNPLPIADAGINDTICYGQNTQLFATGGVNYIWSPSDSLSDQMIEDPIANPIITTDYVVQVTDLNACVNFDTVRIVVNNLPLVDAGPNLEMCIFDTLQLAVSGAIDYIWSPDSTLSQFDVFDPLSFALDSEIYVVQGADQNGCVNWDTLILTVHDLPIVMANPSAQICIGDTIVISAVGADSYSWTPTSSLIDSQSATTGALPTDTTNYYVVGTDLHGCQNIDSITITVNPLPNAFAGLDVSICRGDSTQLVASGGESYIWSPSVSIINPMTIDPIVFPDTTLPYIVMVTDSNGCVNWDTTLVNVFRVRTNPDTVICLTDSFQLNVYGSPGNQFSWSPIDGLSNGLIMDPWASPIEDITYTVTVTDVAGCVDQASIFVEVNPIPIISFSYQLIPDCDGVQVEFTDSSSNVDQYQWIFSNASQSDEKDPITLFDYGTNASLELILTNNFGCTSDTTTVITLDDFDDFYGIHIPNVFTPNGDGQNDYFWVQVPGNLSECLDLKIYNRWGQLLFKSFGGVTTWDGKNSDGDVVPDGTYLYTIEIEDFRYEGTLTIFR
ncbi:MAG: gliding motility-associated C-terminal domain-containing protein [Flavobacteriales bacterium]|nr:gliding motility-associated C-terminal domain-containing protein [Flavobacteriales bacterium]